MVQRPVGLLLSPYVLHEGGQGGGVPRTGLQRDDRDAERLEVVELAGPYERMRSSFLGGVKRMPIRYRLKPA